MIIIPARLASNRFPGKLLYSIQGQSVLAHTWSRCKASALADQVLIASEDDEILELAKNFGGNIYKSASNHICGTDRCGEVIEEFPDYEFIINVQADEMLVEPRDIDRCIEDLNTLDSPGIASLYSPGVRSIELQNINKVKVILRPDGTAKDFRRNPRELVHGIHMGIYTFHRKTLKELCELSPSIRENQEHLEQLRWIDHDYKIRMLASSAPSISINTPMDLQEASKLLAEVGEKNISHTW